MRFAFKVIIVFLIIFNWRMPVVYNSVVLAILLTAFDYWNRKGSIPFTYFSLRYNVTILVATGLLAFVMLCVTMIHSTPVPIMIKRMAVVFMMLWALIFALPLLMEDKESTAFEEAASIICWAFALQGFIHLLGFIVTPIGEFMLRMQPAWAQAIANTPSANVDRFRLYALTGSVFFELPAAYGVACILFFRLQVTKGISYMTGWKSYIVLFFLIAGICLCGRTGFIGFGIGLCLYLFSSFDRAFSSLLKNVWKIIAILTILIIAFNTLLSSQQRQAFTDDLFPFAFEAYYNWRDGKGFTTGSSNETMTVFYYPLKDATWFAGHGRGERGDSKEGYPSTDSGYMNVLIFGGFPYLLCLIIYQSLYFIRPLAIVKNKKTQEDQSDFFCLLALFLYVFVLEYKDAALGTLHIVETMYLFIGAAYMIRYYAREEEPEELNELVE